MHSRIGSLFALLALTVAAQAQISTARTDVTASHLILNVISPTDTQEVDFATGDIDNDGDLDIVVGRKSPFTTLGPKKNILLLNNGTGVFTDETTTYTNWNTHLNDTRDIELADMNNDGWQDVICYNSEDEPTEIFLNLGQDASGNWLGISASIIQVFAAQTNFNICGGSTIDYNVDGLLDLVRADYQSSNEDDIQEQQPGLTFQNMTSLLPATFWGSSFGTTVQTRDPANGGILDLNNDGNVDMILIGSSEVKAAYTDGMGGFLASHNLTQNTAYAGIYFDIDGDGDIDGFKVNDISDHVQMTTGFDAQGRIVEGSPITVPSSGGFGANAYAVDFDLDGDLDVFVHGVDVDIANCGSNTRLKLFLNTGNPAAPFTLDSSFLWPRATYDAAIGDFDGDGAPDLMTVGCGADPGWHYYVSDPNASSTAFNSQLVPSGPNLQIFEVNNIPQGAGGFRTLYNLFDPNPTHPVGEGPFLGLSADVIGQFFAPPPFVVVVGPGQDQYTFPIPTPLPGISSVHFRSVAVDFSSNLVELTEIGFETL
ncbi:MAG TPA: VCBS repeat-containing protein [Planctomycetes bacterium]|nr:VCBS repeat-containing protein [Planctomycetota bacterium]